MSFLLEVRYWTNDQIIILCVHPILSLKDVSHLMSSFLGSSQTPVAGDEVTSPRIRWVLPKHGSSSTGTLILVCVNISLWHKLPGDSQQVPPPSKLHLTGFESTRPNSSLHLTQPHQPPKKIIHIAVCVTSGFSPQSPSQPMLTIQTEKNPESSLPPQNRSIIAINTKKTVQFSGRPPKWSSWNWANPPPRSRRANVPPRSSPRRSTAPAAPRHVPCTGPDRWTSTATPHRSSPTSSENDRFEYGVARTPLL